MVAAPPSQLHCRETQTFKVSQGAVAELEFNILKQDGTPLNLMDFNVPDPIGSGSSSSSVVADEELLVCFIVRESYTSATILIDSAGEVLDEATGLVRFVLSAEDTTSGGIYTGEVAVFRGTTKLHVMPLFLSIFPSMDSAIVNLSSQLTIPWIRLMLRDACPDANYLIDEVEFSDTEIAFALRNPIDEWNETPPPVTEFTPRSFPFRNHHARAAIAELLLLAGHWYLRNSLSYSAGGLSVNDRDKGNAYITLGERYREEWRHWMMQKKIEINIEGGFKSLVSPYTFIDSFYGFYGF